MIKSIKRILYQALGRKNYLYLVSKLFFISYDLKLVKNNPDFKFHYFIKKLICPNDHVIDIGGNLGYYTRLFSKLVKANGKVWSVEPVKLYRQVLQANIKGLNNVEIIPYALGETEGTIEMGIPGDDIFRHGLTRIVSDNADFNNVSTVEMKTPQEVFNNVNRLDYIKCDVEGYENHIIPQIGFLLEKYKPTLQIELAAENTQFLFEYLEKQGYRGYYLENEKLTQITADFKVDGDTLFIHKDCNKYNSHIN